MDYSRRRSGLGQQLTTWATMLAAGALLVGVVTTRFTKDEPSKDGTPKLPVKISSSTSDADVLAVIRDYQEKFRDGKSADLPLCKAATKEWRRRTQQEQDMGLKQRMELLVPSVPSPCSSRPVGGRSDGQKPDHLAQS